jgi:hypothetical protein
MLKIGHGRFLQHNCSTILIQFRIRCYKTTAVNKTAIKILAIEHKKWSGFRRFNPSTNCKCFHRKSYSVPLWFIARCCQHGGFIAPSGRRIDEWWFGKDLIGSSCSSSKVLTRNCLKGLRKSKKTCQNNQCPGQDSILVSPVYKSRTLPLHEAARCTTVWISRNIEDTSTRRIENVREKRLACCAATTRNMTH